MFVEAFHHVIKYKFLKSRKNKRIDTLIHKLFEYLRFKSYDRLTKLDKGKVTGRITLINKRHSNSLKFIFRYDVEGKFYDVGSAV